MIRVARRQGQSDHFFFCNRLGLLKIEWGCHNYGEDTNGDD